MIIPLIDRQLNDGVNIAVHLAFTDILIVPAEMSVGFAPGIPAYTRGIRNARLQDYNVYV